jgi:hypothetical protein
MVPIPKITRLVSQDGQSYALSGWPELERWACRNSAMYRAADEHARHTGFSETDRMRLIVYVLLQEEAALREQNLEAARRCASDTVLSARTLR